MKTILLVDDEYPAIEAIRTCVDWQKLGIDRVLTADCVESAREQFANNEIEIMLCDIEMPGENGLDLLQWIKTRSPETVGVFLTCHADFRYARDAVRMGAFDYLLKPAPIEDIERIIRDALGEWERRHSSVSLQGTWNKNRAAVLEKFWQDVLNKLIPTSKKLHQHLEARGLNVNASGNFLVIICVIRKWNNELSVWEKYDLDFTIRNILEEIFGYTDACVITDTTGRKIVVIDCEDNAENALSQTLNGARRFQEFLKEHFHTKSCFYVGMPCKIEQLAEHYHHLCEMEKDNVSYDDRIFQLQGEYVRRGAVDFDKGEMEYWKELLLVNRCDEMCLAVKSSLNKMVADGVMNSEALLSFYHEVMQTVYSVLATCHISVQELPDSMQEEYRGAFDSSDSMMKYLEHVIHAAASCIDNMRNQEGVVGKIRQYIEENLDSDLNRDVLAQQVYLNPNYLARIFRNKTGYSLVDYITTRRIEKVKELLMTTDMSVTQIAQQLGYTNMPYFSRVFKKETGCTPVEYRRNGKL